MSCFYKISCCVSMTLNAHNHFCWELFGLRCLGLLSKDKKSTCFLLIGGESIEVERYNTYICECVKSQTYNIKLNITLHLLFSFQLNQSFKSAYSKLLINIKFISIKTTNKNCLIDWVLSWVWVPYKEYIISILCK